VVLGTLMESSSNTLSIGSNLNTNVNVVRDACRIDNYLGM